MRFPHLCEFLRNWSTEWNKTPWTPMFIMIIFTIARIWNMPKCLSIETHILKCDTYIHACMSISFLNACVCMCLCMQMGVCACVCYLVMNACDPVTCNKYRTDIHYDKWSIIYIMVNDVDVLNKLILKICPQISIESIAVQNSKGNRRKILNAPEFSWNYTIKVMDSLNILSWL